MPWTTVILMSLFLGVALAMDAFSTSVANGLNEPKMSLGKSLAIPTTYAFFQFAMPMIGWVLVHFLAEAFSIIGDYIVPWVAFGLLAWIGSNMIRECILENREGGNATEAPHHTLTFATLMLQGIATAIDALSSGLETAEYFWYQALASSGIIAVITFVICCGGLYLGKTVGNKFRYAGVVGGVILILIGIKSLVGFFLGLNGIAMPF